ncbi:hypothetical protein QBC32DRAFT_350118 [Pseudoneurospora amorphoporcata]|uniref:Uncharacterized protein n=1 Tax=Pseudoneurospora amorphoporcata TaxID=241081 RepID=A0AAN6NNA5_9PEZI|nr:hypothetical protein QBC32DRAFT_350118 [Pseudoneurospora amorphoporcata]
MKTMFLYIYVVFGPVDSGCLFLNLYVSSERETPSFHPSLFSLPSTRSHQFPFSPDFPLNLTHPPFLAPCAASALTSPPHSSANQCSAWEECRWETAHSSQMESLSMKLLLTDRAGAQPRRGYDPSFHYTLTRKPKPPHPISIPSRSPLLLTGLRC